MLAVSAAGVSVWGGGESTVRRWSVQRSVPCGARTLGPAAGADTVAPAAKKTLELPRWPQPLERSHGMEQTHGMEHGVERGMGLMGL